MHEPQRSRGTGSPGPIDGFFGKETQAAVITYQSSNSLVVDGIVGPETRSAQLETTAIGGASFAVAER